MKKGKRRNKISERLVLFAKVLLGVLCIGGLGLVCLCIIGQEDMVAHHFFQLPKNEKNAETSGVDEVEADIDEKLYRKLQKYTTRVRRINTIDDEKIKMVFAGDMLLDDNYAMMATYKNKGSKIEEVFSDDLISYMKNADVFVVNNEFTFSTRGVPTQGKKFTFRANPENISLYQEIGVDAVSLANNHAYDYGEESLLDTMETLRNADIAYVGAGEDLQEAMSPYYFVANGVTIALVAATQIERFEVPDTKEATLDSPGVLRCFDTKRVLQVIDEAEQHADHTILYVHWGTENQQEIDWWQEEQTQIFAESGVDVIVGNHPHCLQKIDYVSGVPVVYSLGNFWFNSKTVDTGLLEITISGSGIENLRFVPCLQTGCKTVMLQDDAKQGVLNTLRGISTNVWIDADGSVMLQEK